MASINLCPNTIGQLAIGLMCNEPRPGSESYDGFAKEKEDLSASLRRKAHMMTDFFNSLQGVTCNFTEGAMYSFPTITCACCPPRCVPAASCPRAAMRQLAAPALRFVAALGCHLRGRYPACVFALHWRCVVECV